MCVLPEPVWRDLLFSCMSVEDNLMLPSMRKIAVRSFWICGKKIIDVCKGAAERGQDPE